jgi:hypothetical protein
VRAAGKKLQIRTLLIKKERVFYRLNFGTFDDLVESTLLDGGKSKKKKEKKRWKFRGFSSRTGRSRICSFVHHGPAWSCDMYVCMYVCVGTLSHPHGITNPPVVA